MTRFRISSDGVDNIITDFFNTGDFIMLKEFEERITNAKNKQFRMLERFHIGDAVYPFWLKGIIVYGIVTDVDTVARKVICDFNGVSRQFCPEDLMHVNPELINASTAKKRNASADGAYSKFDDTQLSPDTDNGISATCRKCGGEIAVSYDENTATSDFVCTKCGNRIPEDRLNAKTKKAMMENQMRHMSASSNDEESGHGAGDDGFASKKAIAQELARIAKMLIRMD